MHLDMGGAAAVLAAVRVACRTPALQPVRGFVAVLALAENAIGPAAMYPHQVCGSA
jgi:leucyl aminopeptidase